MKQELTYFHKKHALSLIDQFYDLERLIVQKTTSLKQNKKELEILAQEILHTYHFLTICNNEHFIDDKSLLTKIRSLSIDK